MGVKKRVMVIDDDVQAIAKLEGLLSDYPDLDCVGSASNAADGLAMLGGVVNIDMLFLDIELPDANGIELLQKIEKLEHVPYIVMFTGVYHEYSNEAFSHCESDYLLKPVDLQELDKVVQRFRHYELKKHVTTKLPAQDVPTRLRDIVAVTTSTSDMRILRSSEIGYFRYSTHRKVWEVALIDGSFVSLKKGTSAPDIISMSKKFIQTHKSYIVNLDYVLLVGQTSLTLFDPFNTEPILLGRIFKKTFQDSIFCI